MDDLYRMLQDPEWCRAKAIAEDRRLMNSGPNQPLTFKGIPVVVARPTKDSEPPVYFLSPSSPLGRELVKEVVSPRRRWPSRLRFWVFCRKVRRELRRGRALMLRDPMADQE